MWKAIKANVDKFSEDMLLHYASPNRNLVAEILMLDAATIGQLSRRQLSQYVLVLGQHLVTLQYNENLKGVDHLLLSKTFEYEIESAQFKYENIQGTTAKAKRAWVLLNVPEIKELQMKMIEAEAEKMIISKMTQSVEGLLNALKKELSTHYTD
jgi:hypothetical protein